MQRRSMLSLLALAAGQSALAHEPDELGLLDATAQAALLRSGHLQALDLLEAARRRIDRLDPHLHAFVLRCDERARRQALAPLPDGPFAGVPFACKDAVDLAGTPRHSGSRLLAQAKPSAQSSPIIQRCEDAGLITLGKTATPEFQLDASTEPLLGGPTHNPWDLQRSSGGSSGGSAVAVASGMLPLAHATDGGGSIRIPASCCGVFGLKPSRLRMVGSAPQDGGVDHCVSRTVRDSATLFCWNQRRDPAAPLPPLPWITGPSARRLRIGYAPLNLFDEAADPEVQTALEDSARLCERLGHQVQPFRMALDGETFFRHFMVAWSASAQRALGQAEALGLQPDTVLEPWTLHLAAHGRAQAPQALHQALAYFGAVSRQVDHWFETLDVVLSPVLASVPPPLGWLAPTVPGPVLWQRLLRYVSYTPLHNVAGLPAMSVPLGMSPQGLPIGSQFAARLGDEQTLFQLAFELEQARPWSKLRPRR